MPGTSTLAPGNNASLNRLINRTSVPSRSTARADVRPGRICRKAGIVTTLDGCDLRTLLARDSPVRWQDERESSNVEDRRADRGPPLRVGLPGRRGGLGIGTLLVALALGWVFGINPLALLGLLDGGNYGTQTQQLPSPSAQRQNAAPADAGARFASVVLASTEDVWQKEFAQRGARYEPPVLVLYRRGTQTGCGFGDAAAGPFYCPADRRVYLDLDFFEVMAARLGANGDFAQGYVIAHEVGHHVQNLAGTTRQMAEARQRLSERDYNALSVRLELQADCYAGVWAQRSQQARGWMERGDLDEAIGAAAAVGDDRLQRQSQGVVVPDAFTHGSSAQRVQWFRTGFETGRLEACDTFDRNRR